MTTDTRKQQLPLHQVRETWEERVAQVARLLSQKQPTALTQSQMLIDRLSNIPAPQRAAAEHRLDSLLLTAVLNQAHYHATAERYADAAATMLQGAPFLPDDAPRDMETIALGYLLSDGQTETALAAYEARASDGNLDDWGDALYAAIRCGELGHARRYLDRAEHWVNQTYRQAYNTPDARRDQAMVASMKARYAIAQAKPAEALAWYEHAMSLDEFYRDNPSFLYRHLITKGAMSEALTLVRVDTADPICAGFWAGLVDYRQGRLDQAARHWQKASQAEAPKENESSFLELVLIHYYLGDESGAGLSRAMDTLNTEGSGWGAFYLAGLGWALRGDMKAARTDMRHARSLFRESGAGRQLPGELWRFCIDLLDPSKYNSLKEFFEDAQL